MTSILTWNIQNGKGVDGVLSLARIRKVIGAIEDADVICLQEVSRNLALPGSDGAPDQVAELAALFPGYQIVFGTGADAVDSATGQRWQFGNATLTRRPLLSVFRHLLPRPPAASAVLHMQRQAIEVTIATAAGPMRIVNTHLEYHDAGQRLAQVLRLRELQDEVEGNDRIRPRHQAAGPYQSVERAAAAVYCGDFNMTVGAPEYDLMRAPSAVTGERLEDAWTLVHGMRPHAPTCGVFDRQQWPNGPHCRDYFFVSGALTDRLQSIDVDIETAASDHQPLLVRLS